MITEQLEKLLQDDERALTAAKKRLERCAEGSIHLKRRNGTASFYRELPKGDEGKRREIHVSKKNKRLIASLCTKKYCRELIPVLVKEIALLKSFLNRFDPQDKYRVFQKLPVEFMEHVAPLVKTNAQIISEWENERFDTNPYPLDHDSYLPDGSVSYPDFTILHPETLEVYWLELFGMMDDPDYATAALQKIARYAQSDVYPRLIMIFDHKDAPFRTEALKTVLQKIFL